MARAAAAAQNATLTGSASARIALTSAWAGASARASGPFRGCFAAAGAGFFAFGAGALGGFGAVAFGGAGLVACFFGIAFGAFAFGGAGLDACFFGIAFGAFAFGAAGFGGAGLTFGTGLSAAVCARRTMAFRVTAGAATGATGATGGGAVTTTAAPRATKATRAASVTGMRRAGAGGAAGASSGNLPSSEKGASSLGVRGGGVMSSGAAGEATGVFGVVGAMARSVCSGVSEPVSENSEVEPPELRSVLTARTGDGDGCGFGAGDLAGASALLTSLRPRRRSGNVAMAAVTAARRPKGGDAGDETAATLALFFSSTSHGDSATAGSGLSAMAPWKAGDCIMLHKASTGDFPPLGPISNRIES